MDAAPLAAGWSLLPSLQRAVMALGSEVRNPPGPPVRVVEAMDAAAEKKKKEKVAADRVKGSTLEEMIASTGLVRQDSYTSSASSAEIFKRPVLALRLAQQGIAQTRR